MKKVIYAVLILIIIVGTIITATMGLKVDIIYSKNAQINVYIGKKVEIKDIKLIANEVFQNERVVVQNIELFNDMVSITVEDRTDEELKDKVEQLNTKINEKYKIENKIDDIEIVHNPKIKLSSIIKPYIVPIAISMVIILVYVAIRYNKLGTIKILVSYVVSIGATKAICLSILAITRFPINRLVVPMGLALYVIVLTILGFCNEKKLNKLKTVKKK